MIDSRLLCGQTFRIVHHCTKTAIWLYPRMVAALCPQVYVGGNGGVKPRHADVLGGPWDEVTTLRMLDRFLMYYILTADKLQRTAPWMEKHEGGIEAIKAIVLDDKLGICAELEQRMQFLVNSYECEWKQVVQDPVRRASFKQFVNSDHVEPGIDFVMERGQMRPADWPTVDVPWKVRHVNIEVEDLSRPHVAQIDVMHANGGAGQSANVSNSKASVLNPVRTSLENLPLLLNLIRCATVQVPTSWVDVGAVEDFPPEGGAAIMHGQSQIAVFNFTSKNKWYATQNFCPHKKASVLSRGIIGTAGETPKVACPVHKKLFALETGACLSGEDMHMLTFRAREDAGRVLVELPSTHYLDPLLGTHHIQIHEDTAAKARPNAITQVPNGMVVVGNGGQAIVPSPTDSAPNSGVSMNGVVGGVSFGDIPKVCPNRMHPIECTAIPNLSLSVSCRKVDLHGNQDGHPFFPTTGEPAPKHGCNGGCGGGSGGDYDW
eukprot:SAG31_NODE_882_length_11260_cov_3.357104_8_plen_490_part_00